MTARSELVRWDPSTGGLAFGIPLSGDHDADNEAAIKAVKMRVGEIEKLLSEPHSSSGLTNNQAKLLAREKRQLESLSRSYRRNP